MRLPSVRPTEGKAKLLRRLRKIAYEEAIQAVPTQTE